MTTARDIMTPEPECVATELLNTMITHGVKRLPVIDGNQLVGMVSLADTARALPRAESALLLKALSVE